MKIKKIIKGLFIIMFVLSILSAASLYYSITRPPTVLSNSFLVLQLSGEVAEVCPPDFPEKFFVGEKLSFSGWMENIRKASVDDRIDGIVLRIGPTNIGLAKAQELRAVLTNFRGEGKKVIAFIEACGDLEYYIATAADEVYLQPVSYLFVDGIMVRTTFIRSTLDKVGLEPNFIQIGEYKNAPDPLVRKDMSETHRKATVSLLESIFTQYIDDISAARGKSPHDMREVIDRGYFTAREAIDEGLVDSLLFWDQIRKKTGIEGEPRMISGLKYSRVKPSSLGLEDGPVIAIIYVTGSIVPGGEDVGSDESYTSSGAIMKAFQRARADDSVKAVILRVNSGGGEATASEVMRREAMLTREVKPVITSMSDVAASGGYYIAAGTDLIVANPGTITGSIGVYAGKMNMSKLYEKLGMNPELIKIGENAAIFHETANWTEKEKEKLSEDLWDYYMNDFVQRVADNRSLSPDSVDALGRGRVWSGKQAFDRGLVDRLGTLADAVEIAKEKAGVDPEARERLIIYPRPRKFFERLLSMNLESSSSSESLPVVFREVYDTLLKWERLSHGGGFFLLMPYDLRVE